MTAKSTKERSAKAAAKRKELGITMLRLPAMEGTKADLLEIMAWHGIEEMAEAMTLMIHNIKSLGKDGSAAIMAVPRHEIAIKPGVARRLQEEGRKAARGFDDDEESA